MIEKPTINTLFWAEPGLNGDFKGNRSPSIWAPVFFALSLLLAPLVAQNVASNSATGLTYTTIQAAINAATNNYVVYVYSNSTNALAIYNKTNLTITKSNGLAYNPRITGTFAVSAITLSNAVGVTLSNLIIEKWFNGIYHFTNCHSNLYTGLEIRSNSSIGIYLSERNDGNQVIGNNIWSNNDGMWMFNLSANNTVQSNVFASNANNGVFGQYSSNNLIEGNLFLTNYNDSVKLFGATNNRLLNNKSLGGGWTTMGFDIQYYSVGNIISNNILNAHYEGLSLDACLNNVVHFNTMMSNVNSGVYLTNNSTNNMIGTNIMAGPVQNWGIWLQSGPNKNIFASNLIEKNGYYGIQSDDATNNLFIGNLVRNNSNYGAYNSYISLNSTGNQYIGNTFSGPNQREGIHLDWDDTNVFIYSNTIQNHRVSGIYTYRASNNIIAFNTIMGNATNGILFDTNSINNRVISNMIGGSNISGIRISASATNLSILSNFFSAGANGITAISSTNSLFANNLFAYNATGLFLQTKSYGNRFFSNAFVSNIFAGIHLSVGPTNNTFISNTVMNAATNGVVLNGATNNIFSLNTITANRVGVSNLANALTNRFFSNCIYGNMMTNFWTLTGAVAATNNYWGTRTFPDMLVSPVLLTNSPWLNNLTGINDDWTPPPAPTTLVASNLAAGGVRVHWTLSPAADFSAYQIWRSTNFAMEFSNLITSERVAQIFLNSTTNWDDAPPTAGNYRYWATVQDVNGNESWYSPGSNVIVATGFAVASNSATGLTYGTLQAALDAGGAVPKTVTLLATNLNAGGALYSANTGAYLTNHNITLRGGMNGAFNSVIGTTTLDGDQFLSHVLVISNATNVRLENLNIVGGRAMGPPPPQKSGAGVYMWGVVNSYLSNIAFSNNIASDFGGGLFGTALTNISNMLVVMVDNESTNDGGAAYVTNASNVNFQGSFANNLSMDNGGAIAFSYSLGSVVSGVVASNYAANSGGGVFLDHTQFSWVPATLHSNFGKYGGGLYMETCSNESLSLNIYSNQSLQGGGGAFVANSKFVAITGTFLANQANPGSVGGGLSFNGCSVITNLATFIGNVADYGGGFASEDFSMAGDQTMAGTYLSNVARIGGGGLYATFFYGVPNTEIRGTYVGNVASNFGGAVYGPAFSGIVKGDYTNNTALVAGGAIALTNGSGSFININAVKNISRIDGGAVYLADYPNSDLSGSLSGNLAGAHGGAAFLSTSGTTLTNISFSNNHVTNTLSTGYGGGAIWAQGATNLRINGIFFSNRAWADGGAIYLKDSPPTINAQITGTFRSNYADRGSVLYALNANQVVFSNSTVADNNTVAGGILHFYGGNSDKISGNTITNCGVDSGYGLIHLLSAVNSLTVSNNWMGGTNGGSGVYELSAISLANLSYNTFETNRLQYMYHDSVNGDTNQITDVNNTAYHGAIFAQGNAVYPPPPAVVAAASNVNTLSTYATIQGGINAMLSGQTLSIWEGTFAENLVISGKTNITLIGSTSLSNGPTSSNFLNNPGTGVGILVSNSEGVTIRGLRLSGFDHGIRVATGTKGIQIIANQLINNPISGIYFENNIGFHTNLSNTIQGSWQGMVFSNTPSSLAASNFLTRNTNGILIMAGAISNMIDGNGIFSNLNYGIQLSNAGTNTLTRNTVWSNQSPSGAGVYIEGSSGNAISSNTIWGHLYKGLMVYMGSSGNLVESNSIRANGADGVFAGFASQNTFRGNEICSNNGTGILVNASGTTGNVVVENRIFGGTQFRGIWLSSCDNTLVASNTIFRHSQSGIEVYAAPDNLIFSNNVFSNSVSGLRFNSASGATWLTNNRVYQNNLWGPSQAVGLRLDAGNLSNDFQSNTAYSNSQAGLMVLGATNARIKANISYGNPVGLSNEAGLGFNISLNLFTNNSIANFFSTSASFSSVSNYFGTRTFSNMKMVGPQALDPWLNGAPGLNNDFVPPAALSSLVASNGPAGSAIIHWGPTSAASDFSNYSIFASTNNLSYSNLTDSLAFTNITLAATTNLTITNPGAGTWNLWATTRDTNGNESWYSPKASVTISLAGMVASNSISTLSYPTLQAAVSAAVAGDTIYLLTSTTNGAVIQGKTNVNIASVSPGSLAVNGSGSGTGLLINQSTGISLTGLQITGWGQGLSTGTNVSSLTVNGNLFLTNTVGAALSNVENLTFQNNAVLSNTSDGVYLTTLGSNVFFISNVITANGGNGLWVEATNGVLVVSNIFKSNQIYNLRVSRLLAGVVSRNLFEGAAQYGFYAESAVSNLQAYNNTFVWNQWHALDIQNNATLFASNNLFLQNGQYGIQDDNGLAARHDYNVFYGNAWGHANFTPGANSSLGDPLLDPNQGFIATNAAGAAVDRGLVISPYAATFTGYNPDPGWLESPFTGIPVATNLTTGQPYLGLSSAISTASPGNTLAIFAGTYSLNGVYLDKNLTIVSYPWLTNGNTNAVVLDGGPATQFIFKVTNASVVNLRGLVLSNSGMGGNGTVMYEDGASGTLLSNRIVSGMNYAVKIRDASPTLIGNILTKMQNLQLEGNTAAQILSNSFIGGNGVNFWNLSNSSWAVAQNLFLSNSIGISMNGADGGQQITANQFVANGTAWSASSSSNLVISNNLFLSNSTSGILLSQSKNFRITGNFLLSGSNGVLLDQASSGMIDANLIFSNSGDGVSATNSTNLFVTSNTMAWNATAVNLADSASNYIEINQIASNTIGVFFLGNSRTNTVTLNNIFSNNTDLQGLSGNSFYSNWWGFLDAPKVMAHIGHTNNPNALAPWRLGSVGLNQADLAAPLEPSNVAASNAVSGIAITWADMSPSGATGYRIYRTIYPGTYTNITNALVTLGSVTSFTDSNATPGVSNQYFVTAFDSAAPFANESWFGTPAASVYTLPGVASNSLTGLTYSNLQAAVNAGTNNFTVFIMFDTTNQNLVVSQKTNLAITRAPWLGATPVIQGSSTGHGIFISNSVAVSISNLVVAGWTNGITVSNSLSNLIFACELRSNELSGLNLLAGAIETRVFSNSIWGTNQDEGIRISTSSRGFFASNAIFANGIGVNLSGWSNRFENNNISSNFGIGVATGAITPAARSNEIVGNTLYSNNGKALDMVSGAWEYQVVSNTIVNHSTFTAINFSSASNCLVEGNTLLSNRTGVSVGISKQITVRGNQINTSGWNGVDVTTQGTSNSIFSNAIYTSGQYGVQVQGSSNFVYGNTIASNLLSGITLSGNTNLIVANRIFDNTQEGISTVLGAASYNQILTNLITGNSFRGIRIMGGTNNSLIKNTISNNALEGINIAQLSLSNQVIENMLSGSLQDGLSLSYGVQDNTLLSNQIYNQQVVGLLIYACTNNTITMNLIQGNPVGVSNVDGLGTVFALNSVNSNGTNLSTSGPGIYGISNYFGSRTFTNMRVLGSFTNDPWLNGPVGNAGDFQPPAALISLVASNVMAGGVAIHWGPTSIAPDFSNYFVFASSNFSSYSNLSSAEIITNVTAAATTNITVTPPAYGTYYIWVTARDTNGNESWYSPVSSVTYSAPVAVASNSVTALTYASLQAAIDAATNSYAVYLLTDTSNQVLISGKTNLTLSSLPGAPSLPVLSGNKTNTGIMISNSSLVTISNLSVSNFAIGIYLFDSQSNTISSNRLAKHDIAGLILDGFEHVAMSNAFSGNSNGMFLLPSGGRHRVIGNQVYGLGTPTGTGIALSNSASNSILANQIMFNQEGILLFGASSRSNLLWGNTLWAQGNAGISLQTGPSNNLIVNNFSASNMGYGILLSGSVANMLVGNQLITNAQAGIFLQAGMGNLVVNNKIGGPGQQFGIRLDSGEYGSVVSNNWIFKNNQWGAYFGAASNNLFFSNEVLSNNIYGIETAGSTALSNRLIANYIHDTSGQGIYISAGSIGTHVLSNLIQGNSQSGVSATSGSSTTHAVISGNTLVSNATGGVDLATAHNYSVLSNSFSGLNQPFGISIRAGSTNTTVRSNEFLNLQRVAIHLALASNSLVEMNYMTGQPTGISNDQGQGHIFRYNISTNQVTNFFSSTASVSVTSNWFGTRTFTNMKFFGSATNDPWLNSAPGKAGDWTLPPATASLVATNGAPGTVEIHWGPASVIGDFSNYSLLVSSNSASYSNLGAGDIITNIFASGTTNITMTPGSSGTWNAWVTTRDINGNESWYSPMATVVYTAPIYVASNTNTTITYTTLQAAVNAAGPGETVAVAAGTYEGNVVFNQKTNITILAWPWVTNGSSTLSVIHGGNTNQTGFWLTNTIGSRIAGFTFFAHSNGIFVVGSSSNNLIDHNLFLSNDLSGFSLNSDTADGNVIASNSFWGYNQDYALNLFDGDNNRIVSNEISRNQSGGLLLWGSTTGNIISGNDIFSNASGGVINNNGFSQANFILSNRMWGLNQTYGIVLDAGDNNKIFANQIMSNGTSGIRVWNSGGHLISSNDIFNNGTHGIHLGNNPVANVTVTSNKLWGNAQGFGIRVDDGDNNRIFLNAISSLGGAGVFLSGNAISNAFSQNNILSNPTNIVTLDTNFYGTNYFGSIHFSTILSNIAFTNSTNALVPWRLGAVGLAQADFSPPAVPTGLSPSATPSNIVLNWNDMSASGAVSYRIYRSATNNTFTNFTTPFAQTSAVAYTDSAPSSNVTYYYFVTAMDDPGTAFSNESWFSTPVGAQIQDLTVPTANLTNVAPLAWITNSPFSFSGWASNASTPLTAVLFGTNVNSLAVTTGTTNWSLAVNLTGLDGTTNVFVLVASNQNGMALTNYFTNRIDLTPPSLAFNFTYDNNQWTGLTNLSGNIAEPITPITYASLSVLSNLSLVMTNITLPSLSANWATNIDTSIFPSATYQILISVSNQAGFTNQLLATNISFSNFNGALTWVQPTNGSLLSGVTVMTGYVTAPSSTMFMSNTATGGWLPVTMSATTNGSTNWNTLVLPDGTNTLYFGATNQFGGWYGHGSIWVIVDNSPPLVTLTNILTDSFPPQQGGSYLLFFNGTYSDPLSSPIQVAYHISNSVGFLYHSRATNAGVNAWSNNHDFTGYSDGPYWIWHSATNSAGLWTNESPTRFYKNEFAPIVAETNTSAFSWVTNTLDLRGLATNRYAGFDPQTVSLFTNGVFAASGVGTNWQISLPANLFPAGTNVLDLMAVSTNFKTNTLTLTNRFDTTPPALTWSAGWDNATFSAITNISGTVTEIPEDPITFLQVSILTNGATRSNYLLPSTSGVFATNLDITPFPLGYYSIRLSVSNQAGFTNSIEATNILFNNFSGSLVMVGPTNNQTLSSVTTLTGFVTAPLSSMFFSNSQTGGWQSFAMSSSNGTSNQNTSNLTDGSNTFSFGATNSVGAWFGITNIPVIVDNSPALVAITNLTPGQFLTSLLGVQYIAGTHSDAHSGISTSFMRLSNTSGAGSLNLVSTGGGFTNNWAIAALPDGPYWIWTETTNGAGLMTNTATIQVWQNRFAPVLTETNTSPYSMITGNHTFMGLATNRFVGYDPALVEILTNGTLAGSGLGTNWNVVLNTATLPPGTNLITVRSISTNNYTNIMVLTNIVENSAPMACLTNLVAPGPIYGTYTLLGTNSEPESIITGWEWSTNGGALWNSIPTNTNSAWALTLDTTIFPNGSFPLLLRLSNSIGLTVVTNLNLLVSNTPPVVAFTSPLALTYVTNGAQMFSGSASSSPAPLLGVSFATNLSGLWAAPSGTSTWSTNGPWGPFNRSSNTFYAMASNAFSTVTNSHTLIFELARPPLSIVTPVANSQISNVVSISGIADSYSPVSHLSLEVLAGSTSLAQTNLLTALALTNWSWAWNTASLTNGVYDLRVNLTNTAGWYSNVTVTNLTLTNTTPLVLTYASLTAPSSNLVAGTPAPFQITLYDQYTNLFATNGSIPFTFTGLNLSPKGDAPFIMGLPQGTPTPLNFISGVATNISLIAVRATPQSLTFFPSLATNLSALPLTVLGGAPSPEYSMLSLTPMGADISTPITNRVWMHDTYSNPAGSLPTFVFLRYDQSNVFRKDMTAAPVLSNEYQIVHSVISNPGRYVVSAYLDGMSETERVKRDGQGSPDGWVILDLYGASSSNLESLIDRNKGGPTVAQNPIKSGQDIDLFYRGASGQTVTILIHDLGGRILRRQTVAIGQDGLQYIKFQSRDAQGRELPAGLYFVMLQTSSPHTEKYFKLVITR